ncbi:MAG: bifunctional metallophosphatase/5'-nucleotidase [Deltaproteobacteria bacterium]|nr:bifunctional metallophosphatase/5'-nucleotidase [Deltaproteobacteria bacterium]
MIRFKYFLIFFLLLSFRPVFAEETMLTIIHSNDLHSHLLGFSPNIDYTPEQTGNDATIGGWARIATVIKNVRKERNNPVLVLDAGDFLMGSLFHMLSREHAFELRLMHLMGYDMITLGNHEFDLKPQGLVRILTSARQQNLIPQIVLSNAIFSEKDADDDTLEKIFKQGLVKPFRVIEKSGIRIGFFGLMGIDAEEVAPFASPVSFGDPIETAKRMVKELREKEQADIVICLSHSGLSDTMERSEDELLAKAVDGIDIIISGHTHTKTNSALTVGSTIIVQAWEYGKHLGIMDIAYNNGAVTLKNYQIKEINDSIMGDREISAKIRSFEALINKKILAQADLNFNQIIAQTDFDLEIKTEESNLGNLIADSMRWYINSMENSKEDRVAVAIISNGVIRDDIVKGKTGNIAVSDAFRAIPLGIGFDDEQTMGYPLITIYMYPSELKKGLEILTSIYPMKGTDYYVQVSGVKFTYNPNRMLFDRVTEIWLGDEETGYKPLDYSGSNKALIRVAADIYNATFLKIIGSFTWDILEIVPKDRDGNPIHDLRNARVDADRTKPGIQELKEWAGVLKYIQHFPDTNNNGIPDIPEKYRGKLGRQVAEASWNPYKLLKRGTYVTWTLFFILLTALVLIIIFVRWIWHKVTASQKAM